MLVLGEIMIQGQIDPRSDWSKVSYCNKKK